MVHFNYERANGEGYHYGSGCILVRSVVFLRHVLKRYQKGITMTLDEYVAQVQADLIAFRTAYAAHKDDPNWPVVAAYSDWDEQFAFWGEDPESYGTVDL
jgi:hypothetical protein